MTAPMVGRISWYGLFCTCCCRPKTHGQVRRAEDRQWRREAAADLDDAVRL